MELWLENYLSLFLDFKLFGNLNWIAIPLLIYFLVTIKKRKRWEIAIAFVFIFSCLFLSSKKGQSNPRYLLTLYPFVLSTIFLLGWEYIKNRSHRFHLGIFIICTIAILFNFYHFRETYKFYWRYKVIAVDDYFPHDLLKIINNIGDLNSDSTFLVCSQRSLFHYYTNKKGIDYRDPRMRIFKRQKNKETALDVLKNELEIDYIYLHWEYKPNSILLDIISNDCDLVYQDKNGFYLYRIREKEPDKKELERLFVNDSLLYNGSFENWVYGPSKKPDFFEGGDNVFEGMVVREEKEVKVGRYSAKITGDNFNFSQNLSNLEDYKGKPLTCFVWVKTDVADKYRIQIYDGFDSSFSKRHPGEGDWKLLQVNCKINPLATSVIIRVIQAEKTGKVNDVVYVDGALLVEGEWNTFYLYALSKKKGGNN